MNVFLRKIPVSKIARYSPEFLSDLIVMSDNNLFNKTFIDTLIKLIFKTDNFKEFAITQLDNSNVSINNIMDFLKVFDDFFQQKLLPENNIDPNLRQALSFEFEEFKKYKVNFLKEHSRYATFNKSNQKAVHWPNPTGKHPSTTEGANIVIRNFGLIDQETPIGSAGSCFADEMAYYFQKSNYNYIVTENLSDLSGGKLPNSSAAWGVLFNTPSFMQIAERAFGEADFPPIIDQIESNGNIYFHDPYRENIIADNPEIIHMLRQQHIESARKAFEICEVFIITLGLNECFQNICDGSVVSRNPKNGSSFSLLNHKVLTVEENILCLQRFLDIIRAHNKNFKLIVTVSPVPFMATGRADDMHVITANTHSKSVLRVAAEEFVSRNENVWYFPAYEVVTVATRDPWEPDLRHVKRSTVARVMRTFERMFVKGVDPRLEDEIDRIVD